MGSFFNKALQFLSKNWKRIVTSLGTLAAGLFLGKSLEKHEAEKEFSKLQKVIRKQEAKLIALESIQKKVSAIKERYENSKQKLKSSRRRRIRFQNRQGTRLRDLQCLGKRRTRLGKSMRSS